LDFEPGTRYSYSNTGFVLLGRVVEKVSGKPFGEFLSKRILKKLGMNTTFHEPNVSGKQFARGYINFALSEPEDTAPESKGWISAAGAMYSTPTDMMKWDLALMGGKDFGLWLRHRLANAKQPSDFDPRRRGERLHLFVHDGSFHQISSDCDV
jgi:CubicO group peptidase (beta-lactamase class C family)